VEKRLKQTFKNDSKTAYNSFRRSYY